MNLLKITLLLFVSLIGISQASAQNTTALGKYSTYTTAATGQLVIGAYLLNITAAPKVEVLDKDLLSPSLYMASTAFTVGKGKNAKRLVIVASLNSGLNINAFPGATKASSTPTSSANRLVLNFADLSKSIAKQLKVSKLPSASKKELIFSYSTTSGFQLVNSTGGTIGQLCQYLKDPLSANSDTSTSTLSKNIEALASKAFKNIKPGLQNINAQELLSNAVAAGAIACGFTAEKDPTSFLSQYLGSQ